ncbi:MAG: SURF1 family protein [Albidovulum sp.]|nr:SURF1 family protein [Albidovulum sp.]
MIRGLIGPAAFGLAGAAVLVSLGAWQVQRLNWKQSLLSEISDRIAALPVELPESPAPSIDNFLAVSLSGRLTGRQLRVLTSRQGLGPGYRIVAAFESGERRVLLDRGFVRESRIGEISEDARLDVEGNLHWPREWDRIFTPEPDGDLWFARDVESMADALGTEPVMVVARSSEGEASAVEPWPVDSRGVPNNHLQYAATWFSLAAIWLAMTAYWVRRLHLKRA